MRGLKFSHAAALALPLVFISVGCMFPFVLDLDPNVHPGWKCPQAMNAPSVLPTPPCAWISPGLLFDSCRQQTAAMLHEEKGCVPDPTTVPKWAVLVPPMDDQRRLNPMAPLSQWKVFAVSVTADECKTALAGYKRATKDSERAMFDLTRPVQDSREAFSAAALPFAQCVAKDDPRLKGS